MLLPVCIANRKPRTENGRPQARYLTKRGVLYCVARPKCDRIVLYSVRRKNGRQENVDRSHLAVAERMHVATGGARTTTFAAQGRREGVGQGWPEPGYLEEHRWLGPTDGKRISSKKYTPLLFKRNNNERICYQMRTRRASEFQECRRRNENLSK